MRAGWGFRFGRGPLRFWIYWRLKWLAVVILVLIGIFKIIGGYSL